MANALTRPSIAPPPLEAASAPAVARAGVTRFGRSEKRRFKRVKLVRPVRLLDAHGREYSGRLINISGGGALVAANARLRVGDNVILYTDALGRLAGDVVRTTPEGFAMRIHAPALKRDKIVDCLTWLVNEPTMEGGEERRAERRAGEGLTIALLGDGRELPCQVIDLSLTGVALATAGPRPLIGETIQVGRAIGRVARYLDNGFAVEFGPGESLPKVYEPAIRY